VNTKLVWWRVAAVVVALVMLLTTLGSALSPQPPVPPVDSPPTIQATRMVQDAAPQATHTGECSARVQVVDQDGQPVEDAEVTAQISPEDKRPPALTDIHGNARWDGVACGSTAFYITRSGTGIASFGNASADDILGGTPTVIEWDRGVLVTGTVVDLDDRPIEGAWTNIFRPVFTDANGQFTSRVGGVLNAFTISAEGYRSEVFQLADLDDPTGLRITLEPVRHIRLTCSGPEPACTDLNHIQCTSDSGESVGDSIVGACSYGPPIAETGPLYRLCACPEGSGTIASAGLTADFDADTTEVRFDLDTGARVTGRLLVDGVPKSPILTAYPAPTQDDVAPTASFEGISIDVGKDGRFDTTALTEGDWMLEPISRMRIGPVTVPAEGTVDLGDLDIGGSGGIEGTATGSDFARMMHSGFYVASANTPDLPVMRSSLEPDGSFRVANVPAGTWRVWAPTAPHHDVEVTVEDGAITDGVTLSLPDTLTLDTLGVTFDIDVPEDLTLATDPSELGMFVHSVEPGSPAAAANLPSGAEVLAAALPSVPRAEGEPAPPIEALYMAVFARSTTLDLTIDVDGHEQLISIR